MGQNGMTLPAGVQAERQQQMAMLALIERTRLQLAGEIYAKIVSQEYVMAAAVAAHAAKKEADPYGTKSGDDLEEAMPETVPFSVDINTAAGFSVNAAACLMCHVGMLDEDGNPVLTRQPSNEEKPAEKGIILGGDS